MCKTNINPYDTSAFIAAYVECALWSSIGPTGATMDDDYGPEDLSPGTLNSMTDDCLDFIGQAHGLLEYGSWTPEQAGHDFWLTRNGHGSGFWDRGKGDTGDTLAEMARVYGGQDLYVGDDGLIYGQ